MRSLLLIFLIAFAVAINVCSGAKASCSPEISRAVRSYVRLHVLAKVESVGHELPSDCALNPANDRYLLQERAKKRVRSKRWECRHCGKVFPNENEIDDHLEDAHPELLPSGNAFGASACLADFCEIFDLCLATESRAWSSRKHHKAPETADGVGLLREELRNRKICSEEGVHKYSLECTGLFHTCFRPGKTEEGRRLYNFFTTEYCEQPRSCMHPSETRKKKGPTFEDHLTSAPTFQSLSSLKYSAVAIIVLAVAGYYGNIVLRAIVARYNGGWTSRSASRERLRKKLQ